MSVINQKSSSESPKTSENTISQQPTDPIYIKWHKGMKITKKLEDGSKATIIIERWLEK